MSGSGRTPWPETTVFWGAGATASLGMPTTPAQGKAVATIGGIGKWRDQSLRERIQDAQVFAGVEDGIADLLTALGDALNSHLAEVSQEETEAAARLFPSLDSQRRLRLVVSLRREYDWDCLRRVIRICPGTEKSSTFLQDLFNILDMHIQAGKGFHVPPSTDGREEKDSFLTPSRLPAAKNALAMLLGLMFQAGWRQCRTERADALVTYASFCDILAELMQEEGLRLAGRFPLNRREFYLFSYTVISMNFDPVLFWLLFNSHRDANASAPHIGSPAAPMKLFHDFGQMTGARPVDDHGRTDVWYVFNESVAQRLNDPDHVCDRRARVGKFYMPHGCLAWRDCPNCGRATIYMGDEWCCDSRTLLPPGVIALPDVFHEPRSDAERAARNRGHLDAVQCSYCGEMTFMRDTPLILQSSFKGNHPSYIEEIQRDMRVCLENTQHVVLLGYSLPPDDVIYRAMLSARRSRTDPPVYCSVVVGYRGPDRWLNGDELERFVEIHRHEEDYGAGTIQAAIDIFGKGRVRAYTGGIPQVFGAPPAREAVLDLLFPVGVGIDCFTGNGVCRSVSS